MIQTDRRRFLRMAGAAAGAAAMPASIRRALAQPAHRATGSIRDVGHVVILMQENRSFDHYFGSLRGVRGFADPRPLRLADGNPVWRQPAAATKTAAYRARGIPGDAPWVLPFHIDTRRSGDHPDGTDHGWSSGHLAWNQGRYDRWVTHKQDALTMGYLRRGDLPFHYALADAFTVCDAYFSSAHADTAINRIYLWSGTADPRNAYGSRPNGPGLEERHHRNGYTWTTYPERLEAHGVSWKLYQGGTGDPGSPTDNFTDNSLEFFARYQVDEGADPDGPLVRKGVSQHSLRELREDVLHGRLPEVSWIVAPYQYSEHPDAAPADGAIFIERVLEALTANAESWSRTVLFVNYDENDGFFDHVVPPMPPPDSVRNRHGMVSASLLDSLGDEFLDLDKHPSEMHPLVPGADPGGLQPIGLGARVPMLVVSPWTVGGWVCSQTFDHTSVLQFLEARFGVAEPNISAWRRAVCGDLTSAFDFSRPARRPPALRAPPPPRPGRGGAILAPAEQAMPAQEPGTRPARALPYQWSVQGRLDPGGGRFWLDFANVGAAGAAFYVYDGTDPAGAPRRYAVAAGDSLSDYWPLHAGEAAYDLRVHGPNGYFCHLRGDAGPAPEAALSYDGTHQYLLARLILDGGPARDCRMAEAYAGEPAQYHWLASGGTLDTTWSVAASSGWYDLAITLEGDGLYLRRYAGRLENGRPGHSDPGPR